MGELENERETEADLDAEQRAQEAQEAMEAEETGDGPAERDEPAETPETAPVPGTEGLSQKDLEKGMKALDREADRHRKRVQEIMGADFDMLAACPLCDPIFPGFIMPTQALPERFPAVRAFIGDPEPRELKHDPHSDACPECDGWGVVATGSRVQGQDELPCLLCAGSGWRGERTRMTAPLELSSGQPAAASGPTPAAQPIAEPDEAARLRSQGFVVIAPPTLPTTGTP